MRNIVVASFFVISVSTLAQSHYVEQLQRSVDGQGTVVIHQDNKLTHLVDGDTLIVEKRQQNKEKKVLPEKIKKESSEKEKKEPQEKEKNVANNKEVRNHQEPDTSGQLDDVNKEEPMETHKLHFRRYKVDGYRIQIYAGNNSRKSRMEAEQAGQRFKGYFPDIPVYTHFYPPRWVCRVGDFRSAGEAGEYLGQIKHLRVFSGVTVIKTPVQVAY